MRYSCVTLGQRGGIAYSQSLERVGRSAPSECGNRDTLAMGSEQSRKEGHIMDTFDRKAARLLRAYTAGQRDFTGWNLSRASLRGARLAGAYLRGAILCGADLHRADLHEAKLEGADLSGASLSTANLVAANLMRANLRYADLREARLAGADLESADCQGADLSRAQLADACLNRANMHGAILQGADLAGASFVGTYLSGANLSGTGWETALPPGAVIEETSMPMTPEEQSLASWPEAPSEWPEQEGRRNEEREEEEEWPITEEGEAEAAEEEWTAGRMRPQSVPEAPEWEEEPIGAEMAPPIEEPLEAEDEAKYGI